MIILNHYKETNIVIQHVFYRKPLSPIVCTEKMKGTASFLKTVLHSIQQTCLCVIHCGCQIVVYMFIGEIAADILTESKNYAYDFLFFQYVKAVIILDLNRRVKSVFLDLQAWHFDSQNAVCKGALAPLNPLDGN